MADTIDFKLLERLPTKNPDSLRELLAEVEQPADRRLGAPPAAAVRLVVCCWAEGCSCHCSFCWAADAAAAPAVAGAGVVLIAAACAPHPPAAAGNVTPLNNADKEALKQRLDALDARRAQAAQPGAGGGAAAAGSGAAPRAAAPPPPPSPHAHHASLASQWLPALHTAQLNRQRHRAEQKRLAEAAARAAARAAQVRTAGLVAASGS